MHLHVTSPAPSLATLGFAYGLNEERRTVVLNCWEAPNRQRSQGDTNSRFTTHIAEPLGVPPLWELNRT